MAYTLFYFPGNANLAPHMALEEISVPYELALLDRANAEHKAAPYLARNPTGRIPTLLARQPDGNEETVFETAAILLHLADRHPEAKLAPAPGAAGRGRFLTWLFHLTNTIQPEYRVFYYPEQHVTDPVHVADAKATAERRLCQMFALVDRELATRPYIAADHLTVADFLLLMLVRWGRNFTHPPRDLPQVGRLCAELLARPSVQRAFAQEGLGAPFI
ncbi:glutathione S-transferase family protein [Nitrospirillum sp. BR 11163]|uniref:glutathione S-transferase family protein n=1 Tax=Nitrospirillum sp. BR 11163 TaxID=3104323 RepID=UPI002AFF46E5|nr:glutathione S-transferase family protein [Nitrospirillum sp. BR 11163]MEA1677402.1 glutathione S-transferase family protein [Nitrospirillum sp. BR 11163]